MDVNGIEIDRRHTVDRFSALLAAGRELVGEIERRSTQCLRCGGDR